jgi:hypothetical protein
MSAETITIIAAVLAFAASIIATIVSIYNSRLGRFVSERWWERKAEAYGRIVESLSALVDYYDRSYDSVIYAAPLSDDERERLQRQWAEGSAEIAKVTHIGAFVISERARDALRERAKAVVPNPRVDPRWTPKTDI